MKAESTILTRVEGAEAVAALRARHTGALLAECEEALGEHLRRCDLRHVRRMVELSRIEMLEQPHFTARDGEVPVDIYVVSAGTLDSAAGLSEQQCRYCEHRQGRAVCVLPCVVQNLRAGVARCVALPPVELGRNGSWHMEPEALQYLPLHYAHSAGVPMPCSAWFLKKSNALREIANNGTRLYPLVEHFAHAGHLPEGVEIRGSGTQNPLLLTLTGGRQGGRLQLLYGDFYSAENAVNKLVVKGVSAGEDVPVVKLETEPTQTLEAICAEVEMFPEHGWQGRCFCWALSMLCHRMTLQTDRTIPREYRNGRLCAEVRRSRRCSLLDLPLCHLEVAAGNLIFNIYAAVYDAEAKLPQPGDVVCAEGVLYAVPDALVAERTAPAPGLYEPLLPVSAALSVVAGGLLSAGYKWEADFKPVFRCGRPELHLLAPDGSRLWVLVDTIVNGRKDTHGYFRYAPDSYPAHVKGEADVMFATVSLAGAEGGYCAEVILHGKVPQGLTFCREVPLKPAAELSAEAAARTFGEMMVSHDFSALLPFLQDDVRYESDTAGLQLQGKLDLLRHLRACFDNWQRRGDCGNLSFLLSSVELVAGERQPCVVACQGGEIISATVFTVKEGRISAISSLAGDVLDTLQPLSAQAS